MAGMEQPCCPPGFAGPAVHGAWAPYFAYDGPVTPSATPITSGSSPSWSIRGKPGPRRFETSCLPVRGIPFTQVPTTGGSGRFLFGPRTPLTIAV